MTCTQAVGSVFVCLCVSVGLFALRSPHPSAGRPSLMVVEAPLLPTSPDGCYTIPRSKAGIVVLVRATCLLQHLFHRQAGKLPCWCYEQLSSAFMFELRKKRRKKTYKMIHVFPNSLANVPRLLGKNNVCGNIVAEIMGCFLDE